MKDRIAKILQEEGLTGARFADEIGVQASSVSHILSGRNNPGTDFLIKILERYRGINPEWLLMGKGEMYKTAGPGKIDPSPVNKEPDLFSQDIPKNRQIVNEPVAKITSFAENATEIEKIIVFYRDKSFVIYHHQS